MRTIIVVLAIAAVCLAGGDGVVSAVRSMVGRYPYSWCGGNDHGATHGAVQKESPYCDDRNVVGFDCSGLSKYGVYQGCGKSIYHGATHQYNQAPNKPELSQKQPGDLLFYGPGPGMSNIHHVTIYVGGNNMVEAYGHDGHCKGIPVRETAIRSKNLMPNVARYC